MLVYIKEMAIKAKKSPLFPGILIVSVFDVILLILLTVKGPA
ncbi:hypothetical protein [Janthinobacterium fluminis]|nr:hypothetical protein [Janthinobacterium fluminis]